MELAQTIFVLAAVLLLAAVAALAGHRLATKLRWASSSLLETFLFGAGLVFGAFQILLAVPGLASRPVMLLLWLGLAVYGLPELRSLRPRFAERKRSFAISVTAWQQACCWLVLLLAIVLGLMAMAPITGSDALHYHFTAPRLTLAGVTFAESSITSSFLTGQLHNLILFGMLLGGAKLAAGLLYLGGILCLLATLALCRRLMPAGLALVTCTIFLLTPMVFWQMTTAGSPDLWMAFYTTLMVLAGHRGFEEKSARWIVLGAIFAGLAAGGKYTAWAVPLIFCLVVLVRLRSIRLAVSCGVLALVVGCSPLVRNYVLTGDPFFPFLTPWLDPAGVNLHLLAHYRSEVRADGFEISAPRLLLYPARMILDGSNYGAGHYFGPMVLAFAPLLFFLRRGPLVWLAGALWLGTFALNTFTSQSGRFLLPVYPLALSLVFAGFAQASSRGLRVVKLAGWMAIATFSLFSLAALAVYSRDFLPAALGLEPPASFLRRMAPDQEAVEFVNQRLRGTRSEGTPADAKVLVFFRHVYYVDVPFVYGHPEGAWAFDPAKIDNAEGLLRVCRERHVKWVVKTGDYPKASARLWQELEARGALVPVASEQVDAVQRWRIYGEREKVQAVLLEFRDTRGSAP